MSLAICSCGGYRSHHIVGTEACFREPCPAPLMLGGGLWQVEGGSPINTFTLTKTRLYAKHNDGTWSRPKTPVSEPTLNA